MKNTLDQQIQDQEKEVKIIGQKYTAYKNGMLEGGEGYNQYETKLEVAVGQLGNLKRDKLNILLSGDSLKVERDLFNANKFTNQQMQQAQKWCLNRGYTVSNLMSAVKKTK